ncbi:MAG: hypothetical protein IK051_01015 [Rhodocyclaceae bacterium]|nr:hypothetical protein [Rhodocyclaceae bacterium]
MPAKENKLVQRTLDLTQPPPQRSDEQQARRAALAAMPDEQIDYSDAPSLPDAAWTKAAGKPMVAPEMTWAR